MSALDDAQRYARLDPTDMRGLIAALPRQARDAWDAGQAWEMPASFRTPRRVVVVGVGGSAIGADVVASLAARSSATAVQVHRGYSAPVTDDDTLTIACSFSGDTEETLAAFLEALGRPGMRLAISTGGRLTSAAEDRGEPLFRYSWDGPPRTALAYGLFPLLAILQRLGAIPMDGEDVTATLDNLTLAADEWGVDQPTHSNAAKQLALRLAGRMPVIIGAGFLDVAARRWSADVNENAKQWAFHAALPEVDHNVVEGLAAPAKALDVLYAVLLDSALLHGRNRLRVDLTGDQLSDAGVPFETIEVDGDSMIEAVVRACYLGDWVSLYLAMLSDVDPAPMPKIDALKAALSTHE